MSMGIAINLNNQMVLCTVEIYGKLADGVLSAKFETIELLPTQEFPEFLFRWSLRVTQFSCLLNRVVT